MSTVLNVNLACGYQNLSDCGVYEGEYLLVVKFLDDNKDFPLAIISLCFVKFMRIYFIIISYYKIT